MTQPWHEPAQPRSSQAPPGGDDAPPVPAAAATAGAWGAPATHVPHPDQPTGHRSGPTGYPVAVPGQPATSGRRTSGRRTALIAAIAVVILLVLAAVVFVWVNKPGDDGSGPLEIAWTKTSDEERLPQEGSGPGETYATWLVDDLIVRASTAGVAAYRLGDGARAWTVTVPAGTTVCAAAAQPAGGRGVIAFGAQRCDRLGVIDLKAGTLTHTVRVAAPNNADAGPAGTRLVAAGDTAVIDNGGALAGISVTDGRVLWRQQSDCTEDVWSISEQRVVVDSRCSSTDEHQLVTLDPATGKTLSQTPIAPYRASVLTVVSADPLVAVIGADTASVLAADATGRQSATIAERADGRRLKLFATTGLTSSQTIDQPAMAVHGGKLFAVDRAATPWRVVAFDLATGRHLWDEQGNQGEATIIRADDDGLWALETGKGEGHLVRIDPRSGQTTVERTGDLTPAWINTRSSQIFEHRGSLITTPRSRSVDVVPSLVVLR